jgi:hypothetical protein
MDGRNPRSFLNRQAPKTVDLPKSSPYRSADLVQGFSVEQASDARYAVKPHIHPQNAALYPITLVDPPYTVAPHVVPRHRWGSDMWPLGAFMWVLLTVLANLSVPGVTCRFRSRSKVCVFGHSKLQQDGKILLGECFAHRSAGHATMCFTATKSSLRTHLSGYVFACIWHWYQTGRMDSRLPGALEKQSEQLVDGLRCSM